jgi:hypothetical protein
VPTSLGPMPPSLQQLVERWIEDARSADRPYEEPVSNALFIYGGPVFCCYLKASGEVLKLEEWDDVVATSLDDGTEKLSTIVCAAEQRPELAQWLPVRSAHAQDCESCNGKGWLQPPLPRIICTACSGLGWL